MNNKLDKIVIYHFSHIHKHVAQRAAIAHLRASKSSKHFVFPQVSDRKW